MRPALPAWPASLRPHRAKAAIAALTAAALVLLLGPGTPAARADAAVPPQLTDGYGLTQTAEPTGTATNFVITVSTPEVAGEQRIRILLPSDYANHPAKRYPVFY